MRFFYGLIVVFSFLPSAGYGQLTEAEQQAADQVQSQRNQEERDQRREEEALRDKQNSDAPNLSGELSLPDDVLPEEGGPCFEITKTQWSFENGDDGGLSLPEFWDRLTGSCATVRDIASLMDDGNRYYQEKGYITTRVYAPEQNLQDGSVELMVIPGRVSGFRYSDDRAVDRRITTAFPLKKGDLVHLRALEQGLENFNAPRSQSGKFKLFPGETQGESDIEISAERKKRVFGSLGFNTGGFKSSGRLKGSFDVGIDNLLDMNGTLSAGVNTNTDRRNNLNDLDNRYNLSREDLDRDQITTSYNLGYRVPLGNWSFSVGGGYSDYERDIQGVNETFKVEGYSRSLSLGAERLLYRNQVSKHYAFADLGIKRSKNFIEKQEIETQTRKTTTIGGGIRGETAVLDGKLDWRLGVKAGTKWLNADSDIPGVAETDFLRFNGSVGLKVPVFDDKTSVSTRLVGQYSDHDLAGAEQFGIGGRSDVRGFHDETLYGNSGVYLRNEIERKLATIDKLEITGVIGLDAGGVKEPYGVTWNSAILAGSSVGLKANLDKKVTAEASWGHSLLRPEEFSGKNDFAYLGLTFTF